MRRRSITLPAVLAAIGVAFWVVFALVLTTDPPSLFAGAETDSPTGRVYQVSGDELDAADPIADALWVRFAALIPAEHRAGVVSFTTIDDPELSGYVEAVKGNTNRWHVALSAHLVNAPQELDATIVHEFAHMLSLGADQVLAPESRLELRRLAASCPTFFTGEGCSRDDSYLAAYIDRFWRGDLLEEWEAIAAGSAADFEEAIAGFVATHPDVFISDYAATDPTEDFAESFMEWVLGGPTGHLGATARAKLEFFADYAELIDVQAHIRAQR